jgi:hypothetical protein
MARGLVAPHLAAAVVVEVDVSRERLVREQVLEQANHLLAS